MIIEINVNVIDFKESSVIPDVFIAIPKMTRNYTQPLNASRTTRNS